MCALVTGVQTCALPISDASSDQARAPVNGTIPDCTGGVVVAVVFSDQPASEPVDLRDGWLLAPAAGLRGRRCRHRALLSSGGHSGPRRTAAVSSRIWTPQPTARPRHWRCENVRPILPHHSEERRVGTECVRTCRYRLCQCL